MSAKITAAAILIQASPQAVWDVLTDGSAYTEWNSTIVEFNGAIEDRSKISLISTVDPKRTFKLKVTEWGPPSRMVWSAGNFIFKGTRTYTIEPKGDDQVEFRMEERFTGLFSGPISKSIPDLQPSFDQFAADLKTASEAR